MAAETRHRLVRAQQLKPGVRATEVHHTLQSTHPLTRLVGSSYFAVGGLNIQSCVCSRVPAITYRIPMLLSRTSWFTRFYVGAQSCQFHWKSKKFCSGNTPMGHLDAQAFESLVAGMMLAGSPSTHLVWRGSTRCSIDVAQSLPIKKNSLMSIKA